MKATLWQISAPLMAFLLAIQSTQAFAERPEPRASTPNHVYVLGSSPSERAAINKALARLGYAPSSSGPVHQPVTLDEDDMHTGDYLYTEIAMPQGDLDGFPRLHPDAKYIMARPDHGDAEDEHTVVRIGGENETMTQWQTVDLSASGRPETKLLELSINANEAPSVQAEKWVALCDFLGLGYSPVERLKLWKFP